jgi:hypothetical protein
MRLALLALPLLLAGCAAPPACPPGLSAATEASLFFGRSRGEMEVVSDADWTGFLAQVVTPRFPDGLTVLDAAGQWRDRSGRIGRERAKLLLLVLPGASAAEAEVAVAPITADYVQRFGQEAVLTSVRSACIRF